MEIYPWHHARTSPDRIAIRLAGTGKVLTYQELDTRSNQVARLFRGEGLGVGACIAILMDNSCEFLEICFAAHRAGLYYAPISSRLSAREAAHIIEHCGASLLIISATYGLLAAELSTMTPNVRVRYAVGGDIAGHLDWERALEKHPSTPIPDECTGADLIYSSGTTGTPKGIRREIMGAPLGPQDSLAKFAGLVASLYAFGADTNFYSAAPLYHSAPLRFTLATLVLGGTAVIGEQFVPDTALRALGEHRISHSLWVPSMFVQMLKQPKKIRNGVDLSCLKAAIHGAAPCPVPIKEEMIAWWGPVLYEYYAATEGNGFCSINSQEWLEHRGSVGKALLGRVHVLDEIGQELPPGQTGIIYFDGPSFAYHQDPARTASARNEMGWTTLGDVGRVDNDGYLYLTDRQADLIISGGVNVYPQETENVLITHPKVVDVAVLGVPNDLLGEEVKAVVQPVDMREAGFALERELIAFCKQRLAPSKCPLSIDFEPELPRQPNGKLYKRLLRQQYQIPNPSTRKQHGELGARLKATTKTEQRKLSSDFLRQQVALLLHRDPGDLADDVPLRTFGLDSLGAIELRNVIGAAMGQDLPAMLAFEYPSIETLREYLLQKINVVTDETSPLGRSSLLECIRPGNEQRRPLILVHPMGGLIFEYYALTSHLPADIPVYGLRAMGVREHEPIDTDVGVMVDRYLDAIREVQPSGPFYLAGHSFGGLLAYEMARRLVDAGHSVPWVAMFDTPTPQDLTLDDDSSLTAEQSLEQLVPDFLPRIVNVAEIPHRQRVVDLFIAHKRALAAYQPAPFPGRVLYFRASERMAFMPELPELPWMALAQDGCVVHTVPGNHLTMVSDPHVGELANQLRRYL